MAKEARSRRRKREEEEKKNEIRTNTYGENMKIYWKLFEMYLYINAPFGLVAFYNQPTF